MLEVVLTNNFKRDMKAASKRGRDLEKLNTVVEMLANQQQLPAGYRDHNLTGNYEGFRECHITSDWLLVYRIDKTELVLLLFRTGSHSDLF